MTEPAVMPSQEQAPVAMRERSTIQFPYDDLDAAFDVARAVHNRGDHCAIDELAAELKHSSVDNGAFRSKVATARHFGLIGVSRDGITLTTLGRQIVDPDKTARAKADAFLSVPLYKATYEEYRGHLLPPAAGLERKFIELGVSSKQTDRARQAFQRSADQAGFFAQGRDRLIFPALAGIPEGPPVDSVNGGNNSGGPTGESLTIRLHGGGELTLNASVSFFQLPKSDREFVFKLIDELKDYEDQRLLTAPQSASIPSPDPPVVPAADDHLNPA